MRLVCISDTHGAHEGLALPEGDVLIHAGDLSAHGTRSQTLEFMQWLGSRDFEHIVCVAGNHDSFMEQQAELASKFATDHGVILLNDSGCQLEGYRFWGSPITPRFCDWSFMRDPGAPIEAHWQLIPDDTDVLITHGPPFGLLDKVRRPDGSWEQAGCPSLLRRIQNVRPTLHVFGHIHEGRGSVTFDGVRFNNVSSMNEHYQRVHEAVVLDVG